MSSKDSSAIFESLGIKAPPLERLANLLPLLKPNDSAPNSKEPPLHFYPRSYSPGIQSRRTVTTTKSRGGIETNWISTTHVFPAAYPRSNKNSTSPPSKSGSSGKFNQTNVNFNETKDQINETRKKDLNEFKELCDSNPMESTYPDTVQYENEEAREQALRKQAEELKSFNLPQLWSCVERIVPIESENVENTIDRNDGQGVTLVFAHANGFHKEIWEPTIEEILSALAKASQSSEEPMPRIDEIWCIDSVNAGEAGALNRETLGDVVSWFDYPRDISQLLNHFIPPKPSFHTITEEVIETQAASYPFPPKKKKVVKTRNVLTPDGKSSAGIHWPGSQLIRTREGQGRKGRRFVGIGHSFGGACLAMLSNSEPDLFEAVILLDPVLRPPSGYALFSSPQDTLDPSKMPLAVGAMVRKDSWGSKAEAVQYFSSKPFFKAWDPRVLSKHLQFGLRPIQSSDNSEVGPCTLANSKWHEASAFALSLLGSWGFTSLKSGRFKGNYYIITMRDGSIYSKDESIAKQVREAPGKGSEWGEMMDGDHLVAQEQPVVLGAKIVDILPKLLNGKSSSSTSQASIPRSKL